MIQNFPVNFLALGLDCFEMHKRFLHFDLFVSHAKYTIPSHKIILCETVQNQEHVEPVLKTLDLQLQSANTVKTKS